MATIDDDGILEDLTLDIDTDLLKWMTTYEMPALNLTAVILARLTWLAKQGGYEQDFIKLLDTPKDILNEGKVEKVIH
jgi:hypothetical protein